MNDGTEIGVKFFTMLSAEKCKALHEEVIRVSGLEGEFWDVGCNSGGSAALMKLTVPGRTVRLFDSFKGLPKNTERPESEGQFAAEFNPTLLILGPVHNGWVPETFKGLEDCKIALAHVDLDLYESTQNALEFIHPRLVPGGSIVVDDYGSNWKGVTLAVDEFSYIGQYSLFEAAEEQVILRKL